MVPNFFAFKENTSSQSFIYLIYFMFKVKRQPSIITSLWWEFAVHFVMICLSEGFTGNAF